MVIEKCIGISVDLDFSSEKTATEALMELESQGIKIECQDGKTLVIPINFDSDSLPRILRLGQRELRWDQAERLMGGGDDIESLNLGG